VVTAGVHNLIPEGSNGFLVSYGIIFLLQEIHIFSSTFSASFQGIQKLQNTSTKIR
jgi:hypothetical protein